MPYLHEKDIEMTFRPLVAKEMENSDPLMFSCGCSPIWTGKKWLPEHDHSPFIEKEVPCVHWVAE